MVRQAYEEAAGFFVETVLNVAPAQWAQPALGVWSVRELVGHANRGLLTVEMYLDQPAAQVDLPRPIDYSLQAKISLGDPAAVAARGREAGVALGAEPGQVVQEAARRVLARVNNTADDALVGTPVGGMRLIDYLPSRIIELVIHTLDLRLALGLAAAVPEAAAVATLHYLTDLAVYGQPAQVVPLLLAITGRQRRADSLNVFGL